MTGELGCPSAMCTASGSYRMIRPGSAGNSAAFAAAGLTTSPFTDMSLKYHVPYHIVGCFGDKYQVYCSKGILNTSIPGSEVIVPLSKCLSIQLHKWRLAPRVSLKSVVSDPAVTECCDCSFPKSSKCTVILSSSEDEDKGVGRGIWIKIELYSLTNDDREMFASPKWLTDNIITAAQMLILQHFPSMSGLQPPCVQQLRRPEAGAATIVSCPVAGEDLEFQKNNATARALRVCTLVPFIENVSKRVI